VVNATDKEQRFDLSVAGARVSGPSRLWQLTGESLEASDRVGQPPEVVVKESSIGDDPLTLTVAPISVNIYQFPVTETTH
jgi:alpha-N-arabinofuranosidase